MKPDYPNNLKEIHNRSKDPQENSKLMSDFSKNFLKGLIFVFYTIHSIIFTALTGWRVLAQRQETGGNGEPGSETDILKS